METLDYKALAAQMLAATHPKEKRRPPTNLEKHEHVKDGTMRYLFEHEGTATPDRLVEFFGFSKARLTKILSELEGEGLVERCMDPADRRRVIVHLTEGGREYAARRYEGVLEHMTMLLTFLGEEDAKHFVRILQKLHGMERKDV